MEYLKVKPCVGMSGIVKVTEYSGVTTRRSGPFKETEIANVLSSVFYGENEIKVYERDTCCVRAASVEIEKITRKEYYETLNSLKTTRIIHHNDCSANEPYMLDRENSTNTVLRFIAKPGFVCGKRPVSRLEYFESLGAAYPVTDWVPFVNEPYERKIDTERPGFKFVPEESTVEKSVFRIIWPDKKKMRKHKGFYTIFL